MKKLLLLICFSGLWFTSQSQNKSFLDINYIETQASADTLVIPDEIKLSIIIKEIDSKGKTSTEVLEQEMKKVLSNLDIDIKENLVLSDATSNFKSYLLKKKDILKSKNYILTLNDALTTSKVILALEQAQISNVSIKNIRYSKVDMIRTHLKAKAVLKAKAQADHILSALNKTTGDPLHIIDQNYAGNYNQRISQMTINESDKDSEFLDVEFQKIQIKSSLIVKFAIN